MSDVAVSGTPYAARKHKKKITKESLVTWIEKGLVHVCTYFPFFFQVFQWELSLRNYISKSVLH